MSRKPARRKSSPAVRPGSASRSTAGGLRRQARRSDAVRSDRKLSSPRHEAALAASAAVATLVHATGGAPRAGGPFLTPAVPPKAAPRFPEDDYDYGYLKDFLSLDFVPGACRAVVFACGKGEEAVYLSERGYRVTGLDADRNAVGLARERAWLNGRDVDFMIGEVFESANLLPAESFGFASDRGVFRSIAKTDEDDRERRRYLDLVRRLLLPGGVFLLNATEVDPSRRAKTPRRGRRNPDDLLVQQGGEVMGEVLRAGLEIAGRKIYPVPGGDGRAVLLLYCRK